MLLQPVRIEMQHLVAPGLIGQGIAGMDATGRHQHQAARRQPDCRIATARKDAATGIDGADGKRGMAVRLVAGAAVAGAPALHMGQGGVAVEDCCTIHV